jgi:hypothetical protein
MAAGRPVVDDTAGTSVYVELRRTQLRQVR